MTLYLDVAVNVPLNQTFTYKPPLDFVTNDRSPEMLKKTLFGRRLEVRFGNRKLIGFVVGIRTELGSDIPVPEEKIRPATRFVDDEPLLTSDLVQIAKWMSRFYLAPIGEAVCSMVPSGKRETETPSFSFQEDADSFEKKELSMEQRQAVRGILGGAQDTTLHYLYGMTGSGKTEVFLSAAEEVLAKDKGVIYLVPEISLTPQVARAVTARFGNTAAILHSSLTPSQRLGEWKRILRREARVVVGARSAVFAPVPDLGLIIIDEEHDGSYKAGSSPRYHARQVAMYRTHMQRIPLVMGSATPSVEAWNGMQEGTIMRHSLTRRLAGGAMPRIESVNLSREGGEGALSRTLVSSIKKTLAAKRQVILFLNRRGFTHFFRCTSCGFELTCKNCSVALTYHKAEKRLRCHYCGYSLSPPQHCPSCGSYDVGYSGFGTEYIEAEVRAKFPHARIVRIDTDSVSHKGELQLKLDTFKQGGYDILLGTQMVAKGLNFPKVQLVGVVLADTALHLPDFRAAERTFSLITQVAGRAGRFFPDGEVIVQSYSPDREPIALAVANNPEAFYQSELAQRKVLRFPPFARLVRFVFRSQVPNAAEAAAEEAARILASCKEPGTDILGPAECPLHQIGGSWREQILLRGENMGKLQAMAKKLAWDHAPPKNVHIEVDVDPVNML